MSVRVVARIRPLLKAECERDIIVRAGSKRKNNNNNNGDDDPAIIRIPNPKNESEDFTFQFNSVYDAQASQEDVFQAEVGSKKSANTVQKRGSYTM
ncbi:MAG: hypothetical protein M1816_007056 [Peltula sp. TS41687]|nr:MAG: hypothetical protein M1816_007056 [Peltula sp. TS41687]